MTVKELLHKLLRYPDNIEVTISTPLGWRPVNNIHTEKFDSNSIHQIQLEYIENGEENDS